MAIKKSNLHVFICVILANMTQVSDVAPGPLVFKAILPIKTSDGKKWKK
jgi:hypothetical protein